MEDPAEGAVEGGEQQASTAIVTLPNFVTIVRLSCLPLFLWLLFGREDQTSELGKILDPVADRLLFFIGAGGILIDGSVPTWFAVVVLAREVLVAGATLGLAALGARRIDVTWWGKAGTFGLMVAFPLFLVSHSDVGWHEGAGELAWVAAIPGLGFSLYAAATYVPIARRALADGRAARQPAV
jgi:cardiolipin synthase